MIHFLETNRGPACGAGGMGAQTPHVKAFSVTCPVQSAQRLPLPIALAIGSGRCSSPGAQPEISGETAQRALEEIGGRARLATCVAFKES